MAERHGHFHQRGFTLMEILVVLVIGALLVGIVGVQMSAGGPGTELRSSTRELASGLRYVRSMAMSQGQETVLLVDIDEGRYWFEGPDGRSRDLPDSVRIRLVTAEEEIRSESVAGVRFFPDGSATGGRFTVSVNDRSMEVDVDWLTGRIEILDS